MLHRRPLTRRNVLATPLALAIAARTSRAQGAPPHIVYMMADDMGYADLSCYGRRDYTTPNIDRLAAEGMEQGLCFWRPCSTP